ncbi:hypothetical protein DSCA_42360 [Desulfosarcina alkanivorans]|uniref:Porin domain-containing protein n=1 Tax=Desulfosarcina alkanivorans TaxID=571177 RepID=A0A5K7YM72_9BACT|nr:LbtU family siderophore porin [Desulfosarcina alkanivorans]BBO70306.1 hypothetical protein DSCA_42360 [Desulfosarcina alkanivorans]
MKKGVSILAAMLMWMAFCSSVVYAEALSNQELSERIGQLEKKLDQKGGIFPDRWNERIALSGLIEAEAGYIRFDENGGDSSDESDIAVATVELGIDADIAKHVLGHVLFLYEDGEDIVVDEATITLSGEDVVPAYLIVGEMYVPFGNFESHMISDPLTLEIAETREASLQVGVETGGFHGSAFIFNGDVDEAGEDDNLIDNFGANAGYTMESDAFSIDVGVSYINNLLDGDSWEDVIDDGGFTLNEYTAGMGTYAVVGIGSLTFIGEYITALDDIEWIDEADDRFNEDEISAWNLEVCYAFSIGEKEAEVAAALQGTDEAQNRLPETRYLGAFGLGIFESTNLSFEYTHSEFENDDEEDAFTAQLAIEF